MSLPICKDKRKLATGFGGGNRAHIKQTKLISFPMGLKFKKDSAEVKDPNKEEEVNLKENALVSQSARPNEDTSDKHGQKGSGIKDPFEMKVATYEFDTSSSDEDDEPAPVNKIAKTDNKQKFNSFFKFM